MVHLTTEPRMVHLTTEPRAVPQSKETRTPLIDRSNNQSAGQSSAKSNAPGSIDDNSHAVLSRGMTPEVLLCSVSLLYVRAYLPCLLTDAILGTSAHGLK